MTGGGRAAAAAIAAGTALLALPAAGQAQPARPAATTGPASNVEQTTAVLNGAVLSRGVAGEYFFRYGPTKRYGATTPVTPVPAGNRRLHVSVAVSGLQPDRRYHYRLVARNPRGVARGGDRSFATRVQPLALTLGALPNPVRPWGETALAGHLTGTGGAGREVVLQANPFPYARGFQRLGNPQVTAGDGGFLFGVLAVPVTTQFRVVVPSRRGVVSPVVTVGAKVSVGTHLEVDPGRRGGIVRVSGRVAPAVDGAHVVVEKRRDGVWRRVGSTFARHDGDGHSRYVERLRQERGGTFRVVVEVDGAYVGNHGREIPVSTRRLRD